jgi:predicted nucleic-acid-binding Zn-ribbon protein
MSHSGDELNLYCPKCGEEIGIAVHDLHDDHLILKCPVCRRRSYVPLSIDTIKEHAAEIAEHAFEQPFERAG